jgi:hypothetical protein
VLGNSWTFIEAGADITDNRFGNSSASASHAAAAVPEPTTLAVAVRRNVNAIIARVSEFSNDFEPST